MSRALIARSLRPRRDVVWDAAGHDDAVWGKTPMSLDVPVRVLSGDLTDDLAGELVLARRVAWDIETTGLDWRTERIGTCQLFAETVGVVVLSVGEERPPALRGQAERCGAAAPASAARRVASSAAVSSDEDAERETSAFGMARGIIAEHLAAQRRGDAAAASAEAR
jgi:hypothetical protein